MSSISRLAIWPKFSRSFWSWLGAPPASVQSSSAVSWSWTLWIARSSGSSARNRSTPVRAAASAARNSARVAKPRLIGPDRSCPAEGLAQLVLGRLQGALARRRQVPAGAVEVEGQHRHRRSVRARLAPPAAFGRALERLCDAAGRAQRENIPLEGQRVAVLGDLGGPVALRWRLAFGGGLAAGGHGHPPS